MPIFSATVDNIALAAAGTAKTLLELATASTARAKLISWWVEFQGVSASAKPVKVELMRATATITGTGVTETKFDDFAPTPLAQAIHTATAEGTPGDLLESHRIHPQSGIVRDYPLGREVGVPVSGFVRIRCTQDSGETVVNAAVGMLWEE